MKIGRAPHQPNPRERGAALILVIWSIGLMAVMAAMVAHDAHLDARESRITRETLSARLLAQSAIRLALERLDYSGASGPSPFPIHCALPGGEIHVDVRPVSGLIDINAAQEELLAALFTVLGTSGPEAAGMAARIADFRDGDATPRPGGAEGPDYARAGLSWRPANRPFSRNGELSEVLSLNAEMIAAAMPHLTVHSHDMRVEPAFATPEVAEALQLFGAVADDGIDSEQWEAGASGSPSAFAGGPIVLSAQVRTPSGQTAAIAATYSSRSLKENALRVLLEEHPAAGGFLTDQRDLPPPDPCF